MGGEGGDAEREGEGDSCGAGVVAEVAGVGGPCSAAHQGGAHNGDGKRRRMAR